MLPILEKNAPNPVRSGQDPFFVSSALCIFSALVAFCFFPKINQDTITHEDRKFREFLEANGYDTTTLGVSSD